MTVFERRESEVRSYSRSFPAVFDSAKGPYMFDTGRRRYIDFFCGAGTLNYGHNPPEMVRAVQEYLAKDGVIHSLDMWTSARINFLETFESVILQGRGFDYKVQFTGPTGANGVEAALKAGAKGHEAIERSRVHAGLSRAECGGAGGNSELFLQERRVHQPALARRTITLSDAVCLLPPAESTSSWWAWRRT